MASATFRLGTAATNSAGTVWSWRDYDTAIDADALSYVKVALESTTGVQSVVFSISSADNYTLSAGTTPSVATVQSSKTATFRVSSSAARTYLIRAVVNSGLDQNGDAVAEYDKSLAVHRLTAAGLRLVAVGERDEADRVYGYTPKLNAMIVAIAAEKPPAE